MGLSLEDIAEQGTLIGATPGLFQGRTGVVTPAIPAASEPVERGTMPEEPIPIASSGALDQALEVMNLEAECESVKDELDLEHQSKACAAEVSLFPLELVQQGLIAIDSSSGSDSSEYIPSPVKRSPKLGVVNRILFQNRSHLGSTSGDTPKVVWCTVQRWLLRKRSVVRRSLRTSPPWTASSESDIRSV